MFMKFILLCTSYFYLYLNCFLFDVYEVYTSLYIIFLSLFKTQSITFYCKIFLQTNTIESDLNIFIEECETEV